MVIGSFERRVKRILVQKIYVFDTGLLIVIGYRNASVEKNSRLLDSCDEIFGPNDQVIEEKRIIPANYG